MVKDGFEERSYEFAVLAYFGAVNFENFAVSVPKAFP